MIHLTLIIVDFLTGLLAAGAWALASAGGAVAGVVGGGLIGMSLYRRWRRRGELLRLCRIVSTSRGDISWLNWIPKRLPVTHLTRPLVCKPSALTAT
jgi:hypothetical protein